MKADPKVRKDGKCAVCKQPRRPERSRKYAPGIADADPFCDVKCARLFHGQPDLAEQGREARKNQRQGNHSGSSIVHGTRETYRMCACPLCTAAVKGAR